MACAGISGLVRSFQGGRDLRVAKRNPYSRWRQASARLPVRGAQASGAQRGAAADHHLPAGRRPGSGRGSGREGRRAHHPGILCRAPGPGDRGRAGQGSHGPRSRRSADRWRGSTRSRAIPTTWPNGTSNPSRAKLRPADLDRRPHRASRQSRRHRSRLRNRSRDASGTGGCRPEHGNDLGTKTLRQAPSTANRPRECWSASNRHRG